MEPGEEPSNETLFTACLNPTGQVPPGLARNACNRLLETRQLNPLQSALAFLGRARAALQERDHAAALADADRAVGLDPDLWQAHFTRGRIQLDYGRFPEAIAAFDRVLALSPGDALTWCARGTTKRLARDYNGAMGDLNEASRLNPAMAEPWSQRSLICTARGERDFAVSLARSALARAPGDPLMSSRLCWALAIKGEDLEEALALAEGAIRTWPADLNYLDARGIILLKLGRLVEALAVYDDLMARAPDDATRYRYQYARGVAGWWNGKTKQGYNDIFMSGRKGASLGRDTYRGYGIDHDHPV